MDKNVLIEKAFEAMKNAYAPYSNYHVGACIYTKDGKFIPGCNIENAAYGSTICAERCAVYGAYSNGYRKDDIIALAIVTDGKTLAYSCGACRQVLSELLNPDTPIYLSNGKQEITTTPAEMLPFSFTPEDLIK
ncbi:MAG: cytidine deaminase [Erysipelotrichaceae bacterium]|nr:cytidine deaminase [Erysipelotrichaceae bacterium]